MKLPRRQFLQLAVGAAALPALPRIAKAQANPTRPVRIFVGLAYVVRFSPDSDRIVDIAEGPFRANCGLMPCNKPRKEMARKTYSITSSGSDQQYVGKL
jgi:hypothetical protein